MVRNSETGKRYLAIGIGIALGSIALARSAALPPRFSLARVPAVAPAAEKLDADSRLVAAHLQRVRAL